MTYVWLILIDAEIKGVPLKLWLSYMLGCN